MIKTFAKWFRNADEKPLIKGTNPLREGIGRVIEPIELARAQPASTAPALGPSRGEIEIALRFYLWVVGKKLCGIEFTTAEMTHLIIEFFRETGTKSLPEDVLRAALRDVPGVSKSRKRLALRDGRRIRTICWRFAEVREHPAYAALAALAGQGMSGHRFGQHWPATPIAIPIVQALDSKEVSVVPELHEAAEREEPRPGLGEEQRAKTEAEALDYSEDVRSFGVDA